MDSQEVKQITDDNSIDRKINIASLIFSVLGFILSIISHLKGNNIIGIGTVIIILILIPLLYRLISVLIKKKNTEKKIWKRKGVIITTIISVLWILSVASICFYYIGEISDLRSENEKLEVNGYINFLVGRKTSDLINFEDKLIAISSLPVQKKIKLLGKILLEKENGVFHDEIMPVVYHAMIGVSKSNYKNILNFSFNHLHSWNKEKVLYLFKKEYFNFDLKKFYIEKLNEKLKNITFKENGSIHKDWFLYFAATVLKNIENEELKEILEKSKNLKKIENSRNLFVRLRVAEIYLQFNEKKSIEILTSIVDEELKLNKPHKYNTKKEIYYKNIILKRAAEILGYIKNKDSIILLKRLILEEKNTEINEKALSSLVKLGKTASDSLIELLNEKNDFRNLQMKYIVTALGEIKDRRAIPGLKKIIELKPNSEIRLNVIEALGKIGNYEDIVSLIRYLALEDQESKICIIKALGRIKDKRAVSPLLYLIKENENQKDILAEVVAALGNIGDIRAIDPIIKILKMNIISDQILENAGIALGKFAMDSPDKLISILEFNVEYENIQLSIISALGKFKNKEMASNALINCLKTTDNKEKQKKIIEVLGEIGNEIAITPLISFIKDEELCEFAANALGKIGWSSRAALVYLEQIYYKNSDLSKNYIIARAMINICPWNRSQIKIIDQIIKNPLIKMPLNCLIKNDISSSYALLDLFNVIGYSTKNKVNLKYYNPENFWVMMDWWARYKQMWN